MNKFTAAVLTITGTIIGAGIFGIPFVVHRAGFWTGMLCILILGIALILLNMLVGEISLRTKKLHQLTGYAEKYLGKSGKIWMLIAFGISCYSALIAYTIGVSETLFQLFGVSQLFWMLIFYLIMSVVIYGNLKVLTGSEYFMEFVKFTIFAVLLYFMFTHGRFNPGHLSGFSFSSLAFPLGVILFAFGGSAVIPLLRNILKRSTKRIPSAIFLGSIIPIVVYALFAVGVVGLTGAYTTEVATVGLAKVFQPPVSWLIHAFALLAMITSMIAFGFVLKWTFIEDFNLSNSESWAITMAVPPLVIALGLTSFYRVLDLGGSFATSITGLLILFIHYRARKKGDRKPEYRVVGSNILYLIIGALFVFAIVNSLVSFF